MVHGGHWCTISIWTWEICLPLREVDAIWSQIETETVLFVECLLTVWNFESSRIQDIASKAAELSISHCSSLARVFYSCVCFKFKVFATVLYNVCIVARYIRWRKLGVISTLYLKFPALVSWNGPPPPILFSYVFKSSNITIMGHPFFTPPFFFPFLVSGVLFSITRKGLIPKKTQVCIWVSLKEMIIKPQIISFSPITEFPSSQSLLFRTSFPPKFTLFDASLNRVRNRYGDNKNCAWWNETHHDGDYDPQYLVCITLKCTCFLKIKNADFYYIYRKIVSALSVSSMIHILWDDAIEEENITVWM